VTNSEKKERFILYYSTGCKH